MWKCLRLHKWSLEIQIFTTTLKQVRVPHPLGFAIHTCISSGEHTLIQRLLFNILSTRGLNAPFFGYSKNFFQYHWIKNADVVGKKSFEVKRGHAKEVNDLEIYLFCLCFLSDVIRKRKWSWNWSFVCLLGIHIRERWRKVVTDWL